MTKPVVEHVGLLVEDLEQALAMFTAAFGVEAPVIKELTPVGLRAAVLKFANVDVELLQYAREDSPLRPVLGQRTGVNHISVLTEDMEGACRNLERQGVPLAAGFPRQGSRGLIAFNQPGSAQGVLMELYQLDPDKK